jgi:hypothetical protein
LKKRSISTQFNGKTVLRRIVGQTQAALEAGWWGFWSRLRISGLDSYFTYLGKLIIDDGIVKPKTGRPLSAS